MHTLKYYLKFSKCLKLFLLISLTFSLLGSTSAMGGKRKGNVSPTMETNSKAQKLENDICKKRKLSMDLIMTSEYDTDNKRHKIEETNKFETSNHKAIVSSLLMSDLGLTHTANNYDTIIENQESNNMPCDYDESNNMSCDDDESNNMPCDYDESNNMSCDDDESTVNHEISNHMILLNRNEIPSDHTELFSRYQPFNCSRIMARSILNKIAINLDDSQIKEITMGLDSKIFIAKSLYYHGIKMFKSQPSIEDDSFQDFIESMLMMAQLLKEFRNYNHNSSSLWKYANEHISNLYFKNSPNIEYYIACLKSILDDSYTNFGENKSMHVHINKTSNFLEDRLIITEYKKEICHIDNSIRMIEQKDIYTRQRHSNQEHHNTNIYSKSQNLNAITYH